MKKFIPSFVVFTLLFQIVFFNAAFAEEPAPSQEAPSPIGARELESSFSSSHASAGESVESNAAPALEAIKTSDPFVALNVLKQAILNMKQSDEKVYSIASSTNANISKYFFDPTQTHKFDPLKNIPGLRGDFAVSPFSGAAGYTYTFDFPPGRNGMRPSLLLGYNNHDRRSDSPVGFGWNLDTGYIVPSTRRGLPDYDSYEFAVNLWGDMVEIAPVSLTPLRDYSDWYGTFGAKTEGDFKKYELTASKTWIITDASGVKYIFGDTLNSFQPNPFRSAGSWGSMYRWMLTKVEDANGNTMTISYTDDFLPSEINYTGKGTEKGPITIRFMYDLRQDAQTSYKNGFLEKTTKILNKLQVVVSGSIRREYEFIYQNPSDGAKFSLLAGIAEAGWNERGEKTLYPQIKFTYKAQAPSWSYQPTFKQSMPMAGASYPALRIGDLNGDSLPDFVNAYLERYDKPTQWNVFFNAGDRWEKTNSWSFPDPWAVFRYSSDNTGMLIDVNGDLKADMIQSGAGGIYANTGTGFEFKNWWSIPNYTYEGGKFLDVNADGFVDYVYGRDYGGGVRFNSGTAFSSVASWNMPVIMTDSNYRDLGVRFGDLNGDGLPDIIQSQEYETDPSRNVKVIYLNTGTGWIKVDDGRWSPPVSFSSAGPGHQPYSVGMVMDLNADGFSDIVYYPTHDQYSSKVYMNNGVGGWVDVTSSWKIPFSHLWESPSTTPASVNVIDINGDGIVDYLNNNVFTGRDDIVYVSNGDQTIYYLSGIDNSLGLSIDITYARAQIVKNKALPFPIHPVSEVAARDGLGQTITKKYKHEGGVFYYNPKSLFSKEFAGFNYTEEEVVSAVNPTIIKRYFHQAEGSPDGTSLGEFEDHISKKGRPYREEIWGKNKNGMMVKYKQTLYKWGKKAIPVWKYVSAERFYVFLERSVESLYDAENQNISQSSAKSFEYDAYGNRVKEISFGAVAAHDGTGDFQDIAGDTLITKNEYAKNTSGYAVSYMNHEEVDDDTGVKLSEKRIFYDNAPFGQIIKGNVTKEEMWNNTPVEKYVQRAYSYDSYGNAVQTIDENGNVTTAVFDSVLHFYPTEVRNPKNHVTTASYDIAMGSPLEVIDVNGYPRRFQYDGLGRILKEYIPDLLALNPRVTLIPRATYEYHDAFSLSSPVHIVTQEISGAEFGEYKKTVVYLDAFSKVVQTRAQALENTDAQDGMVVTDQRYNEKGENAMKSYPYYSSGLGFQNPYSNSRPSARFAYDALGRVIQSSNQPGGDVTTNYSGWNMMIKNGKNIQKDVSQDAYGRIIAVREYDALGNYTTNYSYDALGNLVEIKDSKGNIRHFAYDSLGRKLKGEILHAPHAVEIGTWVYEYDDVGNMTKQTDPNNSVVAYVYDELNRILEADYSGKSGKEVVYTYDDNAVNAIGKVRAITGEHFTSTFAYDAHGNRVNETKSIDGITYSTKSAYTNADTLNVLEYPQGGSANYAYDAGGRVVSVSWKSNSQAPTLLASVQYTAMGQKSRMQDGAGIMEEYQYVMERPWRLLSKTSTNAQGKKLQSYAYQYDAVDNIMRIDDFSDTQAYKSVLYEYDTLNRLTRASSVNAKNVRVKDWAFPSVSYENSNYDSTYAYDSIGNMIHKGNVGAYVYADTRHPTAVTNAGNLGTTFKEYALTYDAAGNMTRQVYRKQIESALYEKTIDYEFDYYGRLVKSTIQNGGTTEFWYGEGSQRLAKMSGNLKTIYAGKHIEVEQGKTKKYIFLGNNRIATIQEVE